MLLLLLLYCFFLLFDLLIVIQIIWDPYLLALIDKLNELIKEIEISASSPYKWPEKKTSFEYILLFFAFCFLFFVFRRHDLMKIDMRFCEQLKEKSGIDNRVKSACALNLLISNCIISSRPLLVPNFFFVLLFFYIICL